MSGSALALGVLDTFRGRLDPGLLLTERSAVLLYEIKDTIDGKAACALGKTERCRHETDCKQK